MWWPRGWGYWWYINPYLMYPPYPPYAQTPQQPAQQPPAAPYYPYYLLPPFVPPPLTPEQEIEALERYKAEIGDQRYRSQD